MPTNLTEYNIDETFGGLIHAQGAPLPLVGKIDLYDGVANRTSLRIGRLGTGATIYAGVNENSFTVSGDISGTGRAILGHMEASTGSTAPNIAKAYVVFKPSDQQIYTGYGVSDIDSDGAGKYTLNLDSTTQSLLDSLSADKYAIFVNMTIEQVDKDTPTIYSAVASNDSTNSQIYIRCSKFGGGSIEFFDPSEVSVAIYKS
jgi:hypothetical protein